MKAALVHDWVINNGGAEKCLEAFHGIYPQAPLYTLIYAEKSLQALGFDPAMARGSMLQKRRNILKNYRRYLPIFPYAIEQFDLSAYDLILSSSHCVAKGVLTHAGQTHICYCHTPVRYAWDLTYRYLDENLLQRGLKSTLARIALHYLRLWDQSASQRVDHFIANSRYTARRIWRSYRREAEVIYPPVDTHHYQIGEKTGDYFIFVSRLVAYKKADLVISAFNKLGLPLYVVGDGPQSEKCRKIAAKNIEFFGYLDSAALSGLMAGARALLFAAEEDFGIVPVEAQSCGVPVIAYGRGGATETVIPCNGHNWESATGVYFYEQNVEALEKAVRQFLAMENRFDRKIIRQNAERFGKERFKKEIEAFIKSKTCRC